MHPNGVRLCGLCASDYKMGIIMVLLRGLSGGWNGMPAVADFRTGLGIQVEGESYLLRIFKDALSILPSPAYSVSWVLMN